MAKKSKTEQTEMSFLGHLEELRWHLIRSILAIVVLGIVAFIFRGFIFDVVILAPKNPDFLTNRLLCQFGTSVGISGLCINNINLSIINITMSGQFSTHIMVSLIAGFLVAFPYIFWEFWLFVRPALYDKEKRHSRGAVLVSSLLFITGVLFGYFLIVPLSVNFLGSYVVSSQVSNQINLGSYISTLTSVVLASGVVFELPIVIYFLSKVGLVTPKFLKQYRRHAIVIVFIVSAVITPPDVFSQILVAVPLILLYEVSIFISGRVVSAQERELADGNALPVKLQSDVAAKQTQSHEPAN